MLGRNCITGMLPVLGLFVVAAVRAGEVEIDAGALHADYDSQTTYSWALEYRQAVSDHLAASLTWLNEGHVTDNHRDGQAAQLWWRSRPDPAGLLYEVGIGPYRYYDTTRPAGGGHYEDAHGWGVLASASVTWYFENRWYTSVRLNQVQAHGSANATAVVLGLGYRFDDDLSGKTASESGGDDPALRWEIDAAAGETIVNSFRSQNALTEAIGVRARLNDFMAVSVSELHTGRTPLQWRTGTLAQLWFEKDLTGRIAIAAGAGAFVLGDESGRGHRVPSPGTSAALGIAASYAFDAHWVARALWDRLGTGDNHDADLILLSLGYRF